jgi:RNA polymerase sigma factor (sigma-70 family)
LPFSGVFAPETGAQDDHPDPKRQNLPRIDFHPRLLAACAEAQAGDAVWEQLVARHLPRVRGAVVAALVLGGAPRDPDRIADLVQEVWCRLLLHDRRALARFRGASEAEARAYLRRVARSVVADALRAARADKRRPSQVVPLATLREEEEPAADPRDCPERRLLARDELRALFALCRSVLGPLPSRERALIARLGLLEGWSTGEIAGRLGGGWSEGAINSLLFRLRARLAAAGIRISRRPGGCAASRARAASA